MKKKYIILIVAVIIVAVLMPEDKKSSILYDLSKNVVHTSVQLKLTEKENNLIYRLILDDIISWAYGDQSFINNESIRITAQKLFDDYSANEIKADNLYLNKRLVVTGTISSIDRSYGDNYFLSLKTKNMFSTVHAKFKENYKEILANLHKGETYVMGCIGDGMLMGSPMLKNCKPIVEWAANETDKIFSEFPKALKDLANEKKEYSDSKKKEILRFAMITAIVMSIPKDSSLFDNHNSSDGKLSKTIIDQLKIEYKKLSKENVFQKLQNIFMELGIDNIDLLREIRYDMDKSK